MSVLQLLSAYQSILIWLDSSHIVKISLVNYSFFLLALISYNSISTDITVKQSENE